VSELHTDTISERQVLHEIERAADRLIKVHGRWAFNHAARRIDVARKKGDQADHIFWMQIAEKVKRELPARA
jgi:aspartokinase-like uncharacterized kinase